MGLKLKENLTRDFAGQKEVDFEILDRSENCLCAVEQIEGKGRRYTKLRNLSLRSFVCESENYLKMSVF